MLRWPFIDADQRDFAVAPPSGPHQIPIDQPSTQTTFTGTSGNNTVHGTSSADVFNMFQGGNDTVFGNGGNDEFHFGASFTANDMVRGGAGEDILFLSGGAYSAGLTITSAMLQNVEQIHLTTSNNFKFIMASGLITANPVLSVDASVLDAAHHLTLDASALSQTMQALGGQGDDTLTGGSGDDLFNSFATGTGGTDKMYGGAGEDRLRFAGDFTAADHVDGGADFDALILAGDYSAGLALGATTLVSIETINLGGISDTHDYSLTMADANVAAGADMFIVASGIQGGHGLIFNGAAETNGHFIFTDSAGNDSLTGGALSDEFSFSNGGNDAAYGGAGDDLFNLGVTFGSLDSIHGGSGVDSIELFGSDYALTITGSMIEGIEKINFDEHHNFSFTMTDGAVGAGDTLSIGGVVLDSSHTLVVDGSAETNGSFIIFGGLAGDTLTGGALADNLRGGAGADILTGGGGDDVFEYIGGASDSTSTHFDTINHFDADDDLFSGLGSLTGIDHKVAGGALSLASFDSDLAAAIGSGQLAIDHAVLFTPDSGDLAGDTFLIVELNGTAGYQASQDLVIKLDHPSHINHLSLTNF